LRVSIHGRTPIQSTTDKLEVYFCCLATATSEFISPINPHTALLSRCLASGRAENLAWLVVKRQWWICLFTISLAAAFPQTQYSKSLSQLFDLLVTWLYLLLRALRAPARQYLRATERSFHI
jgi:hypothetical protein